MNLQKQLTKFKAFCVENRLSISSSDTIDIYFAHRAKKRRNKSIISKEVISAIRKANLSIDELQNALINQARILSKKTTINK